ncbi:hypothetical protein QM306_35270, partial [Burkholderia cenocepacia]|nr:hypothetical protein [Burkholderia cenocepacia]
MAVNRRVARRSAPFGASSRKDTGTEPILTRTFFGGRGGRCVDSIAVAKNACPAGAGPPKKVR